MLDSRASPSPQIALQPILHIFSSFEFGGAQARFAALLRGWPRTCEHVVIAMDGRHDARRACPPEARMRIAEIEITKGGGLANRARLRELIATIAPSCVVTYNWGAIEGVFANIPRLARHVHVEDGFGRDEANGRFLRRSVARGIALRLARAEVIVPSFTLQSIALREWRVPKRRLHVLINGVELPPPASPDAPPPLQSVLDWAAGRPIVAAVGALRAEKRFDRLVEAVALAPRCVLVLAGDGPERQQIEDTVARCRIGDRVRLLGHTDRPRDLLAIAALFALSSETEQLPMSMLEAMSHALPVVATDVGDVMRCASDANRPWIVSRSPEAIAAALSTLIDDEALRRRVGEANLHKVRSDYAFQSMCDRWWAQLTGTTG